MKRLQSILVALALIVLTVPCVHAEQHVYELEQGGGFCPPVCRGCSHDDDACHEIAAKGVIPVVSFCDVPVPQRLLLLYVLEPVIRFTVEVIPPPGELPRLQTVQLLI